MSDPTGGSSRERGRVRNDARKAQYEMTADDSLEVEAYGARGAAMRRTAATVGEAVAKSDADSSFVDKVKARVKKVLGS